VPSVQAAYGPELPEILGPRRTRALLVVAGLVAVVALVLALRSGPAEQVVVGRGPAPFNFVYDGVLRKTGPAKVEERRGDVFVQSMDVLELRLPAYRGDPGGTLPVLADRLARQLADRYRGFRVVSEGRARINESPGYAITWDGSEGGRRIFGRDYLLLPDVPGTPRLGARLALRATYAAGVSAATDVGAQGPLKRALRSFRFGTERP
jgi:hypothetical protein